MPVESEADRLSFLNVAEFGSVVTLFPNTVNEVTISGIFDNEHYEVDNGLSVVSSSEPQLQVRTSDVSGVGQDDALNVTDQVNGVTSSYTVADIQDDGTGITILRLHRA